MFTPFEARYHGKCCRCSGGFNRGDNIVEQESAAGKRRFAHVSCARENRQPGQSELFHAPQRRWSDLLPRSGATQ